MVLESVGGYFRVSRPYWVLDKVPEVLEEVPMVLEKVLKVFEGILTVLEKHQGSVNRSKWSLKRFWSP